jgi:membrane associated rhomboid family serine protease
MVYVKCKCGSGLAVPEDFLASLGECPDCRRTFRVVGGTGTASVMDDELDARLVIKVGPQRVGEQLLLRGESSIEVGKLPGKPIELVGNMVSRNHCKLVRTPKGWRIEDLKSTNGLYVNGKRVALAALKPGDCVRVGDYELEYTVPQPIEDESVPSLDDVDDMYELAAEPTTSLIPQPRQVLELEEAPPEPVLELGPDTMACPSCSKVYLRTAKYCTNCGIDIHTGKALLVSSDVDEDAIRDNTEKAVRAISWFIPFGLYPIKSEGFGSSTPYAVWGIAALTTFITICVWITEWTMPDGPTTTRNLMMWTGRSPTTKDIVRARQFSKFTHWGNPEAFDKKVVEYKTANDKDAIVRAYNDLEPDQRFFGEFHYYQLITNGFLHGGILHIAGNLLFLLVFGTRVNAMIGQWRTVVLYTVLLIVASASEYLSAASGRPIAALGASGAIMGLAGMYFVMMPVHRVYLTIWFRFVIWVFVPIIWSRAFFKVFALRGFWVVLFFIFFDVLATLLRSKDGVAHWAHLGGFIAGGLVGLILLLTRQVDAHSGDIISAILGRRAWALLGTPGQRQHLEAAAA